MSNGKVTPGVYWEIDAHNEAKTQASSRTIGFKRERIESAAEREPVDHQRWTVQLTRERKDGGA